MRRSSKIALGLGGLCLAAVLATAVLTTSARAALKPGDAAPPFTVEAAQGGHTFTFDLAAALKKGPVVLYFYPKSFTSVCTVEAHDFADAMPDFAKAGASVIGMSADDIATQREFSSKECRDTFPVGADPALHVARTYDVALAIPGTGMGFAKRVSYVIAPDGRILSVLADGDAAPHIKNALAAVRALASAAGALRLGSVDAGWRHRATGCPERHSPDTPVFGRFACAPARSLSFPSPVS